MTHTEESMMALADEWYSAGEFSERAENREHLRLVICEVLAELANAHGVAQACEARARKAEAECERLRKDAERLDWIDSHGSEGLHVEIAGGEYRMRNIVTVFGRTQKQDVQASDIRTAIDAAMKDQP